MNEHDMRIRKQWLIMWALSLIISITNQLWVVLGNPALNSSAQLKYLSIVPTLVGAVVFGYAMYRCIYLKPGTKLLIFCLAFTALNLLMNPILYFNGKLSVPDYIPYYGAFLLMTQGSGILWLIVCWRMLKVNKRLKNSFRNP